MENSRWENAFAKPFLKSYGKSELLTMVLSFRYFYAWLFTRLSHRSKCQNEGSVQHGILVLFPFRGCPRLKRYSKSDTSMYRETNSSIWNSEKLITQILPFAYGILLHANKELFLTFCKRVANIQHCISSAVLDTKIVAPYAPYAFLLWLQSNLHASRCGT